MATRGSYMYVHNSMAEFSGASENVSFICNFLKKKLMVSDKKIHRAFRTHTTLQTNRIREMFYFDHLPKLYIALIGVKAIV